MKMQDIYIVSLAEKHKGILKAAELIAAGLNFRQIRQLTTTGIIVKIGRGMYRFPDYPYDERVEMSKRIPDGVFCLYSACFMHELSDFVPSEQHLAVPKKSRYVLPDYPPVQLYYWSETAFQLGVMELEINGSLIKVYDPEKTICDICRLRAKTGADVLKEVLKAYLMRPNRDLAKLHLYARKLRVEKTIHQYLNILL